MIRTIVRLLFVCIAWILPLAHPAAQAQPDPWYGRQAKPQNFDQPKVFTGAFQIELPKGWHLAPGHTGTIFSVAEHTKKWETLGFITLEYQRLVTPLDPTVISLVADKELQEVQARELSGKQFTSAVKTGPSGPIILVQYDRPGISGTDDHVAQYSIPIGTTMYRLICIAPSGLIDKYRPIFAHVAASFAPAKGGK